MAKEKFGVSEIDEIRVRGLNGNAFFVLSITNERVNAVKIEGKRGMYRFNGGLPRRDLGSSEIERIARENAPSEAAYYIPYFKDRRTISYIEYYRKE